MRTAFTLIELMIVVSIVGILAMIVAIPAYQNYYANYTIKTAYVQLSKFADHALANLSEYGSCIYPGADSYISTYIDKASNNSQNMFSGYRVLDVGSKYDGCVLIGYFRTKDQGGHANFSGKVLRIHSTRPAYALDLIRTCYTDLPAGKFELSCNYGVSWASSPTTA